ncbi:MAG: WYL domain-containing protein [Acidimicrobiales bacterium]|nr:WYL domain-containing protein [Acidimicrobiales bacterium]
MTPAPRETAAARLQRILTELLWIAERDGPTWDEAAAHLGVDVEVLRADLTLASMIGADSDDYLDMPVELYTEGDRVHVTLHGFDRPLRLTPAEALVLLVAAQARVDRPGSADDSDDEPAADALTRALDKVARLLGVDPGSDLDVDLGIRDAAVFDALRRAVDGRRAVEIEHLRVADDARTTRVVEPWTVFRDGGGWYLTGHCRRAGAERVFRVDRIVAARVLDEPVDVPADPPTAAALRPDADAPRLVLDLAPDARWVAESYPTESVEPTVDGGTRITLAVTSVGWAERLLLRLGPLATVVRADPPMDADLARAAAERILARYEGEPGRR